MFRKTAAAFTVYFARPSEVSTTIPDPSEPANNELTPKSDEIFTRYLFDLFDNDSPPPSESEGEAEDCPPPAKQVHTKLSVPACIAQKKACEQRQEALERAKDSDIKSAAVLPDIEDMECKVSEGWESILGCQ
jgi:hypothetical protein